MRMYVVFIVLLLLPTAFASTPGISGDYIPSTTESFNAPDVGNIRILQTKYEPYPAEPGQIVTLWVAVQNWGEDYLTDVYLRVVPEYPFSVPRGDGIIKVGDIAPFGERLVEYILVVDESAIEGTYSFDVQQCSDDACTQVLREAEVSISVKTGGTPRVRIGLEESDIFYGGKTGELTLNIVNRGKLDIKFLTITLLPSDEYEILSPAEVYIGELESDDFETADFKIFVYENIAKDASTYITLPVRIEYADSNNKDYDERSQVKLRVYSQDDLKRFHLVSNKSNSKYIVVSLILVGAGYVWWKRKKRRSEKTHTQ